MGMKNQEQHLLRVNVVIFVPSSIVVPNNAGNLEAYCRQCPDDVTL